MEILLNQDLEEPFLPLDVVSMVIQQNVPLVKAWRLYKGLSVAELSESADLRIYEIEQLEAADNTFSFHLEKVAEALGLDVEQLVDL